MKKSLSQMMRMLSIFALLNTAPNIMLGQPDIIITGYMANPAGTDSPNEYIQLIATKDINFATNNYCIVVNNNGTATANGWKAGGAISYGFDLTNGAVTKGSTFYVGGSARLINGSGTLDISSLNWIKTINTGTTGGDGSLGNFNTGGIFGNGGANADGIGVFSGTCTALTSTTIPIDAIFFGTGVGTAKPATGGYVMPTNDKYSNAQGTFGFGTNTFTFSDPASGQLVKLAGEYNLGSLTWTTSRSIVTITGPTQITDLNSVFTLTSGLSSSANSITGFTIANTSAIINGRSITATVPSNIILSNTTATGFISANATVNPSFASVTNFSSPVLFTVTAQDLSTQVYTVTAVNALSQSSAKTITGFNISGQISSVINGNIINVTVPFGTNLTSLSPTITVSPLASVNPASGAATNFSAPPVNYTVTAEDGTTNGYQVTVVTQAGSTANSILTFSIGGQVTSQINGNIINVTVPFGTNLTSLTPTYTISVNASASPVSGVANDFSSAVNYVVTAQAGGTNSYSVVVSVAPQIVVTGGSLKNIAVLRLGVGGATALTANGSAVFIDQYTNSGSSVNSTNVSSSINLLSSGTATSEGALTLSQDGQFLAFLGYNLSTPHSSSASGATSAVVPRVLATLNGNGIAQIEATTNSFFSANNIRAGVKNGNSAWAVGGNSGIVSMIGTPTTVSSTITNIRTINVQNGNLFFSTGSGTVGVYSVSGLPTSGNNAATIVFATGTGSSPYGFSFNSQNTIAYVADDRSTSAGGIQKWVFSAGTWSLAYTLGSGVTNIGARGLLVDWTSSNPTIYATTAESSTNRLIKIVDSGASSTATTLATSGTNQIFRGVAFAPTGSITGFTLPTQIGSTTFSGNNISIILPAGSSLTNLTPTITKTFFGTVSPTSAQNFSSPVQYIVDGVNTYTVSVTLSTPGSNINTWNGSTWSQGTPTSSDNVIVSGALNISAPFTINSLTVSGGATLTVLDNQSFTVSTSLVNNGTVIVNNLGSFIQNGTYGGSGTFQVNKNGASGATTYNYWSSPVSGFAIGSLGNGNRYEFTENTNTWLGASGSMTIGKGYTATGGGNASFSGTPNNGPQTIGVTNGAQGWNLVGNPYPSGLTYTSFYAANNTIINGTIYFWNQSPSTDYNSDYASYNSGGGTAALWGGSTPTGVIPSAQGFFVQAIASTNLSFTNAMRASSNSTLLRVESNSIKSFKLNLTSATKKDFNQILVVFADDASDEFDAKYDGEKRKGNPNLSLASKQGDKIYSIQGLSSLNQTKKVQLSIDVANKGKYTFKPAQIENFEENTEIQLIDKLTGDTTILTMKDSLVVDLEKGEGIERFALQFKVANTDISTGIDDLVKEKASIYAFGSNVLVNVGKSKFAELSLMDLTGKIVFRSATETGIYPMTLSKGIYVASLLTENAIVTKKIILE